MVQTLIRGTQTARWSLKPLSFLKEEQNAAHMFALQRERPPSVKRQVHVAGHPPSCSAEVINAWSYTSTTPYAFMERCIVQSREILPLLYYRLRALKQTDFFVITFSSRTLTIHSFINAPPYFLHCKFTSTFNICFQSFRLSSLSQSILLTLNTGCLF
jgi:hypothetical protein